MMRQAGTVVGAMDEEISRPVDPLGKEGGRFKES
jgi:hypothetical protein